MKKLYYNIKYGIINLFLYFKIIWNDRQWDHAYLEELTLFKYKLMYKRMCSKNSIVDWSVYKQAKNKKALKICIDILERRKSDLYIDIHYNALNLGRTITFEQIIDLEQRDWNIYCKLIQQHQQSWWD